MKQTGDEIDWVHIPRELHEQITDELEKLKAQKELDRQDIERLKDAIREIIRTRPSWGEYLYANDEAIDKAEDLINELEP